MLKTLQALLKELFDAEAGKTTAKPGGIKAKAKKKGGGPTIKLPFGKVVCATSTYDRPSTDYQGAYDLAAKRLGEAIALLDEHKVAHKLKVNAAVTTQTPVTSVTISAEALDEPAQAAVDAAVEVVAAAVVAVTKAEPARLATLGVPPDVVSRIFAEGYSLPQALQEEHTHA